MDAPIDRYWDHSPLKDAAKVTTPTIFLVGEDDERAPMPQSVEMYRDRLTTPHIMTNNMTMIMVNIYEAKARLSALLEQVAAGDRVLICKRNQPMAELRRIEPSRRLPRPIGPAKGLVEILPAFFEPLPDEVIEAFEGGTVYPQSAPVTQASAERGQPLEVAPRKARRVPRGRRRYQR